MPNVGGLYQGIEFRGVPSNAPAAMDNYLRVLTMLGFENRVISLFYFPRRLLSYNGSTTPPTVDNTGVIISNYIIPRPEHFGTYAPRNQKLHTYPYKFLTVDCLQSVKTYKWEKGGGDSLSLHIYGALSLNPALIIVPDYDGISRNMSEAQYMNFTDGLTAYSDTLITLFGSNGLINKLGALALNTAISYANPNFDLLGTQHYKGGRISEVAVDNFNGDTGDWRSATATKNRSTTETFGKDMLAQRRAENDIVMDMGQDLISMSQNLMSSSRVRGSGGNYDWVTGHQEIYFKAMGIKEEFARKIDKFFDAYGYAVNTIKVPSMHNRPKWTYVRTRGCIVRGNIPDKFRAEICNIFDAGIRFWAVGAGGNVDIGNYEQDNSPQVEG